MMQITVYNGIEILISETDWSVSENKNGKDYTYIVSKAPGKDEDGATLCVCTITNTKKTPGPPVVKKTNPKSGDPTEISWLIVLLAGSGTALLSLGWLLARSRKDNRLENQMQFRVRAAESS